MRARLRAPAPRLLRTTVLVLALLAVPFLLAPAFTQEEVAVVLHNEDVVRMVAAGMAADRILARIAGSPCEFDLAPDIVDELKVAGVPDSIIEAMRRQDASRPRPAPPPSADASPAKGWMEIVFEDDPSLTQAENSIDAPATLFDPDAKAPQGVDLAFVVACTYPIHVPDHWDHVSPLGETAGRHEILFFQAATEPVVRKKKDEPLVFLPHPAGWRFDAGSGEHRGFLGVAARLGGAGSYKLIAAASYENLKVSEGMVTKVVVRLRSETGGRKPARGAEHPVPSDPNLINIGTTARMGKNLINFVTVVRIEDPAPPDESGAPPSGAGGGISGGPRLPDPPRDP